MNALAKLRAIFAPRAPELARVVEHKRVAPAPTESVTLAAVAVPHGAEVTIGGFRICRNHRGKIWFQRCHDVEHLDADGNDRSGEGQEVNEAEFALALNGLFDRWM